MLIFLIAVVAVMALWTFRSFLRKVFLGNRFKKPVLDDNLSILSFEEMTSVEGNVAQGESSEVGDVDILNSGLPKDCMKYTSSELEQIFIQMHKKMLDYYIRYGIHPRYYMDNVPGADYGSDILSVSESGSHKQTSFGEIHPIVEGHKWYRGYKFSGLDGELFIFFWLV